MFAKPFAYIRVAHTICGLLLAIATLTTDAASAERPKPILSKNSPPMRFVVVRSSAPGCEPTCPEWISAEGMITIGSAGKLEGLLKKLGSRHLPIVLHSPGGSVDGAMALGHLIRSRNLDTMVAKTEFVDCSPETCGSGQNKSRLYRGVNNPDGALCSSACPVVLAAGIRRVVNGDALVGIHEVLTTVSIVRTVAGKKRTTIYRNGPAPKSFLDTVDRYFREMGDGAWIVSSMMKTPASSMRFLETYELIDLKLMTSIGHGDILTGSDVCTTDPPADNCRTIEVAHQ